MQLWLIAPVQYDPDAKCTAWALVRADSEQAARTYAAVHCTPAGPDWLDESKTLFTLISTEGPPGIVIDTITERATTNPGFTGQTLKRRNV